MQFALIKLRSGLENLSLNLNYFKMKRGKSKSKKSMEFCKVCREWVPDLKKHYEKRHGDKDNLSLEDLKYG